VCERLGTVGEITEHVRGTAATIYHPAGTCRMGEDLLAVVDAQLRVRGFEGLGSLAGGVENDEFWSVCEALIC